MIKRLALTFVSSLFVALILVQIIRFFSISQVIEDVNKVDVYFSRDKYQYYLSFSALLDIQRFAPPFDLNHYGDMFKAIGSLFTDVDSFADVIIITGLIPIIPLAPALAILDVLVNLVIYLISILVYIVTPNSNFNVFYFDITGWITKMFNYLATNLS